MTKWTTSNIPAQHGRTAVVTGTGGLGYEDALALARAGASVVIAGRNPRKGAEAVAAIKQAVPSGQVRFGEVDLANLASIAAFTEQLAQERQRATAPTTDLTGWAGRVAILSRRSLPSRRSIPPLPPVCGRHPCSSRTLPSRETYGMGPSLKPAVNTDEADPVTPEPLN